MPRPTIRNATQFVRMPVAIGPLLPVLKEAALKVAYAMSDRRNWQNFDGGNITVTFGRLAMVAGLSDEKYARQGVKELAEHGIIEVVKPASRGRFGAGIYRVLYDGSNTTNQPDSETPPDPNIAVDNGASGAAPNPVNLSDQKTGLEPVETGSIRADKQADLRSNCRDGAVYTTSMLQSTEYREGAHLVAPARERDTATLASALTPEPPPDPNDPARAGPRPHLRPLPVTAPADQSLVREIELALGRWSAQDPPVGIGYAVAVTARDVYNAILNAVTELRGEPAVPRGGDLVPRTSLLPQAIDVLARKGKPWPGAAYVMGAARNEVRRWANQGVPTQNAPMATPLPAWRAREEQERDEKLARSRALRQQQSPGGPR